MVQCVKIGGERIPVEPKTVRLRVGDWRTLDTAYPNGGARVAVRTLVAAHVDALRQRTADALGRPIEETHTPLTTPAQSQAQDEDYFSEELA